MPIVRRSSLPTGDEPVEETSNKLVIVAKEKQPCPPARVTAAASTPASMRRLGVVAQAVADEADDGYSVGDYVKGLRTPYDPNNTQERRYRNRIKNRATAITAMCVACTGSRKLLTECMQTSCPLWAFRFGSDPFRGKRK